jgi:hypothetical protein
MALTQADKVELQEMIEGAMDAFRANNPQAARCRAEYPHEGKLRYARGNPGVYVCECGQRYIKDGKGGLRDA